MATAREHLRATHTAAHQHHTEMIAAHKSALEKATAMEPHGHQAEFHKTAIASHEKMQSHCATQMAECDKAADAGDLNKVIPSAISKLAPPAPGIRAIPRFGAPSMPAKANVPEEFSKVFSIDGDEGIAFA